jgi:transposase
MVCCTFRNETGKVALMATSKAWQPKAPKPGKPGTVGSAFEDRFKNMTHEEVIAFLIRIDTVASPEDAATTRSMAATIRCLTEALKTKGISLERVQAIAFGAPTETTRNVLPKDKATKAQAKPKEPKPGHGPRGSKAFPFADRIKVPHPDLKPGDCCPDCPKGHVYPKGKPAMMVRFMGTAPVAATVYERETLRCNACGEVYTAPPPAGVGLRKYDETVPAMAALFRFGTGLPYFRFAHFQETLGVPLPASTMNGLVMKAAYLLDPVLNALMKYAAQCELIYQDDTVMKILDRPELRMRGKKKRKGVYTTGLIAKLGGNRVALFITGMQHAGENLADLLNQRLAGLPKPIQMCDALAANTKGDLGTIIAHCLTHARRKFVEVVNDFPEECRYLLETLGTVYKNDAATKEMSPPERMAFHQEHSGPLMVELEQWLLAQFSEKQVEPNSGLGRAIQYMTNHWKPLTLFLREPGAPLDNTVAERGLKRAIMHRKNSMFYKTQEGARVGDLYMSLIHTAELNCANPFEYLVALLRNHAFVEENPEEWMPWNYQETLAGLGG